MAKTDKICKVCGKGFKGTAKAQVCGATCRQKLKRLLIKGKNPEFNLIAAKVKKKVETKKAAPEVKKQPPTETSQMETPKPKFVDKLNTPFWNELRKKKLGI